jgi:chromosome segregation ATPase
MGIMEENEKKHQRRINELEGELKTEKMDLDKYKSKRKELYENYTKNPDDSEKVDDEIIDLDDKIIESSSKIAGLEARILIQKKIIFIYRPYDEEN